MIADCPFPPLFRCALFVLSAAASRAEALPAPAEPPEVVAAAAAPVADDVAALPAPVAAEPEVDASAEDMLAI